MKSAYLNLIRFEYLIRYTLSKELISVNDAAFYSGKSVREFREKVRVPMVYPKWRQLSHC